MFKIRTNTFVMYDVLIYKTTLSNIFKHLKCSNTYATTDNNLKPIFIFYIKTDIPEDNTVDVETCSVNSQSKCDVINGI
jgi:hypothetical protein